jgi:undecaprenyl-diphosphatase
MGKAGDRARPRFREEESGGSSGETDLASCAFQPTGMMHPPDIWRALRRFALTELGAVVALGVLAAGALGFAEIAEETLEGDARAFDEAVLLALRSPGDPADPIGPGWLEQAVLDITSLGGFAILALIVLGVASYLLAVGKRANALLVVASVGTGTVLSEALKLGFARPRPDLVAHLAEVQSASFPSGHAMLSAIAYLTLGVLLARAHRQRRVKALVLSAAALLTLLVGASRVYLGVHWPTDVLAGWCVGAAWAALCWLVAWQLGRRGALEGDA